MEKRKDILGIEDLCGKKITDKAMEMF